jgi:hypothetical protein
VVVSVEVTLGLEEGAAPLERLRDAYLEPWTHYARRTDLLATFEVAERLWMITAALRWRWIVSNLEGTEQEKYAYTVPSLLKEFLAAHT